MLKRKMALKKLWAIPKDGYLLLLDYDDEDDDINFLEDAHSEGLVYPVLGIVSCRYLDFKLVT